METKNRDAAAESDRNARTSPVGLWRMARDYALAALVVRAAQRSEIALVPYFLAGHAIELALKAYLRGAGLGASELSSRRFGHNLQALLDECHRRGFDRSVRLGSRQRSALHLLGAYYAGKTFEYYETGVLQVPIWGILEGALRRVIDGVQRFCWNVEQLPVRLLARDGLASALQRAKLNATAALSADGRSG